MCRARAVHGIPVIIARMSSSWRETAAPTLPVGSLHRASETARSCSTQAQLVAARPLRRSGAISTWLGKFRRLLVSGATNTVLGRKRRNASAVMTTPGRRNPASESRGIPKSTVTTSPKFTRR